VARRCSFCGSSERSSAKQCSVCGKALSRQPSLHRRIASLTLVLGGAALIATNLTVLQPFLNERAAWNGTAVGVFFAGAMAFILGLRWR
jgi:hypothetical protein